jgi:hypothetical protein
MLHFCGFERTGPVVGFGRSGAVVSFGRSGTVVDLERRGSLSLLERPGRALWKARCRFENCRPVVDFGSWWLFGFGTT